MNKDEKKMLEYINNYGYRTPTNFDKELIEIVKRGYVIEEKLVESLSAIEQEYKEKASVNEYHNSWEKYRNSLSDNTEDVINDITKSFKKHVSVLNLSALNNLTIFLRDLGKVELASHMIAVYIKEHNNNRRAFDLEDAHFPGDVWHQELQKVISAKHLELLKSKSIDEILEEYKIDRVVLKKK